MEFIKTNLYFNDQFDEFGYCQQNFTNGQNEFIDNNTSDAVNNYFPMQFFYDYSYRPGYTVDHCEPNVDFWSERMYGEEHSVTVKNDPEESLDATLSPTCPDEGNNYYFLIITIIYHDGCIFGS